MTKSNKIKRLDYKEWLDIGTKLYGEDRMKWEFVCPMCQKVQTGQDFLDIGVRRRFCESYIGYSCIGRFNGIGKGKSYLYSPKKEKFPDGCDWTLGGLFGGGGREIIVTKDGKEHRRFDFANKIATPTKYKDSTS